jgi:hypothetical protein
MIYWLPTDGQTPALLAMQLQRAHTTIIVCELQSGNFARHKGDPQCLGRRG